MRVKQTRFGQIILRLGNLLVIGDSIHEYRNSRRMAINGLVQQLCKEQDLRFVDFVGQFYGEAGYTF